MPIKLTTRLIAAFLCLCMTTAFAQTLQASLCMPGGIAIGFFNGVFNTRLEADSALNAIKRLDVSNSVAGATVKYELFYNQTGKDRQGVTRFEDIIEVFQQRVIEQDAILSNRWELFWEALHENSTDGTIGATISAASPTLGSLLSALGNDFLAKTVAAVTGLASNPPTIADYSAQKTLLDAHITQKEKIILVAHSQGNLFMNVAYNYGVPQVTPGSLKAVHIAPASSILNGPYTLNDHDIVINGLRVTGSVPPNNVSIPDLRNRPKPNDFSGHELVATYLDSRLPQPYPQIVSQLNEAISTAVTPNPGTTGTDTNTSTNGFFTVTLTWNGAGDIDLHTNEPSGQHVYYRALQGQAGRLDRDNTVANGPEHYTATCDATKLQLGTYQIGINDYSNGTGRTATVQISSRDQGVLLTKSLDVGPPRGSAGDASPISVASVVVAKDAQNKYVVSAH